MTVLPEWAHKETPWNCQRDSSEEIFRLREALAIALEAIEIGIKAAHPASAARQQLKDALCRITELGKE